MKMMELNTKVNIYLLLKLTIISIMGGVFHMY